MSGKKRSTEPPDHDVQFFLDECLPHQVSNALSLVGYPITSALAAGQRGVKDAKLIPYLAENGYTWITKDDEAKRRHLDDIIKSQISTVWVRGIDRRRKDNITPRQLHLMLTNKLPDIEESLRTARAPRHFCIWLRGKVPAHDELDISSLHRKQVRRAARGL